MRRQIQLDDAVNDGAIDLATHTAFHLIIYVGSSAVMGIDDEYVRAGVQDPKIFLTTCRDPSQKLKQFAKVSTGRIQQTTLL